MKKVGMSIPVANEEATIAEFLNSVLNEITNLPYSFTVYLVMDSFSRDNTLNIVKNMEEKDSRIKLIYYQESTGVVSCYLKGFECALQDGCDYIIEMDSGGSHPPEKIKDIVNALDVENYDAVFMSRFMKGGKMENLPFYRTIISRGGTILANFWLGTKYWDATSGFEAFKAEVLHSLDFTAFLSLGGIYQTEMKYYLSNFKYKEIPFIYKGSTTAFKLKWIWIALKTLFKIKRNKNKALKDSSKI